MIISIPNSLVSANHIVNYSRMTKSAGVYLGTAVTIGYDVPWRKIHELLLKSAESVPDVQKYFVVLWKLQLVFLQFMKSTA